MFVHLFCMELPLPPKMYIKIYYTTKRNFMYVCFNFFDSTGHTAQTSDLARLIRIPG